jgi:hypothetical protein
MTPKASDLEEIARRVEVVEEISVADVGVHLVAGVGIHLGALETCWPCSQFFLILEAQIRSVPRTRD